jgi:hypothetical protein
LVGDALSPYLKEGGVKRQVQHCIPTPCASSTLGSR